MRASSRVHFVLSVFAALVLCGLGCREAQDFEILRSDASVPPPVDTIAFVDVAKSTGSADLGQPARDDGSAPDAPADEASVPPPAKAVCGNDVVEPGEPCDDGNTNEDDACANDCTPVAPFVGFHAEVEALIKRWSLAGGAVAVSVNGRLVLVRGYGLADRASKRAVARADRFRVASLSKAITAAAILKLVEDKRLTLDDRAFSYLKGLKLPPAIDPRVADITIRHLLQHSAGWDRQTSGDPVLMSTEISTSSGSPAPASAAAVVRYLHRQKLDFTPGTQFAYSNAGYLVLGRVIEAVTGQPYETWVKAKILAPMGITRMQLGKTRWVDRAADEVRYHEGGLVPSVFPADTSPVSPPYGAFFLEGMDSCSGWITSAVDYTRFLLAIDGRSTVKDLLAPSSVVTMTAIPAIPHWTQSPYWYGMGFYVRPVGNDANWWHFGRMAGTTALAVRNHAGITWVVMFNQRATAGDFLSDVDKTMWAAIRAVPKWPTYDLFARN